MPVGISGCYGIGSRGEFRVIAVVLGRIGTNAIGVGSCPSRRCSSDAAIICNTGGITDRTGYIRRGHSKGNVSIGFIAGAEGAGQEANTADKV